MLVGGSQQALFFDKVDKRLYPMGLIAMQEVKEAVKELRCLVVDLKLPGSFPVNSVLPWFKVLVACAKILSHHEAHEGHEGFGHL